MSLVERWLDLLRDWRVKALPDSGRWGGGYYARKFWPLTVLHPLASSTDSLTCQLPKAVLQEQQVQHVFGERPLRLWQLVQLPEECQQFPITHIDGPGNARGFAGQGVYVTPKASASLIRISPEGTCTPRS